MGGIELRRGYTSKGTHSFAAWNRNDATYSICMINLGNNPNSKLEVVSTLNLLKLSHFNYYFEDSTCFKKYNPKVYLSAVQSVSLYWNQDWQTGQNNGHGGVQSGSLNKHYSHIISY